MNRDLKIIAAPVKTEGHAARAAGLFAQARQEAAAHVAEVLRVMEALSRMAGEIEAGGDAYPPGVRDTYRRVAEQADRDARSILFLMERSSR